MKKKLKNKEFKSTDYDVYFNLEVKEIRKAFEKYLKQSAIYDLYIKIEHVDNDTSNEEIYKLKDDLLQSDYKANVLKGVREEDLKEGDYKYLILDLKESVEKDLLDKYADFVMDNQVLFSHYDDNPKVMKLKLVDKFANIGKNYKKNVVTTQEKQFFDELANASSIWTKMGWIIGMEAYTSSKCIPLEIKKNMYLCKFSKIFDFNIEELILSTVPNYTTKTISGGIIYDVFDQKYHDGKEPYTSFKEKANILYFLKKVNDTILTIEPFGEDEEEKEKEIIKFDHVFSSEESIMLSDTTDEKISRKSVSEKQTIIIDCKPKGFNMYFKPNVDNDSPNLINYKLMRFEMLPGDMTLFESTHIFYFGIPLSFCNAFARLMAYSINKNFRKSVTNLRKKYKGDKNTPFNVDDCKEELLKDANGKLIFNAFKNKKFKFV